jgi:phage terminase large subunit GpA-like protein
VVSEIDQTTPLKKERIDPAIAKSLRKAFQVWKPPSREKPSKWMEREYVISSEESAEPGKYSFGRYAYLRDVVDWFADPDIEMVALPKAAQTGWTTVFTGFVGSIIENDPCRVLVAMPTQDEAEVWSKDRLEPNLAATPTLRHKMRPAKSRDGNNKILHKRFPGGSLKIVGANSSTGLSSWPAKFAMADEVDRYPLSAGGEGDPISLLRKRLQTWLARGGKLGLGSTPKVEQTSIIWHYYTLGDQQRWFAKCPHCGEHQTLEWERLQWDDSRPSTAHYVCEFGGCVWTDLDRLVAVSRGEWRATCDDPQDTKIRSAWIDGLLSPHVTHAELATKWLACESDEQRQAFVNLYLGRPWRVKGDAPEWQRLYDRRESWQDNRLPAGALFLTCGVDVQKDRLEARVWGWGRGQQCWLADVRVIQGDPYRADTWVKLDELLASTWQHESGAAMGIARLAIDSGYAASEVYKWSRRYSRQRVIVVKGAPDAFRQPIGAPTLTEVVGLKRSRAGVKVAPVGSGHIKSMLYGWLRLDTPIDGDTFPPGYVHLPKWADDEELKQLTAEELVHERAKGGFKRSVWTKTRERNEALDCFVYAYAAASHMQINRFTEDTWQMYEAALSASVEVTAQPDSELKPPVPKAAPANPAPSEPLPARVVGPPRAGGDYDDGPRRPRYFGRR